jgi:hypothetical protein
MSSQTHSDELYRVLNDQHETLSAMFLEDRDIYRDNIDDTHCPLAYTFATSVVEPFTPAPASLYEENGLTDFFSLPSRELSHAHKLCQIV